MGYIKEPYGVDFFVDPRPLTEADEKIFSEAIAYYKATGKKLTLSKIRARQRKRVRIKKNTSRTTGKSKA
jgi:hypothetical protein